MVLQVFGKQPSSIPLFRPASSELWQRPAVWANCHPVAVMKPSKERGEDGNGEGAVTTSRLDLNLRANSSTLERKEWISSH